MDQVVVVAMLAAALLHASWHAMVKAGGDHLNRLAGMNVVSTAVALVFVPFVAFPSPTALAILAGSVLLHGAYKIGLSRLYKHGDLSVAYPLARGFTPIFAALIAIPVVGDVPTARHGAGIALISCGQVAMVLGRSRLRPSWLVLGLAAVVGLSVASYTVVDGWGARLNGDWLSFTVWLVVLDGAFFVGLVNWRRGMALWRTIARDAGYTLASGCLGVTSFGIFLWALSRGAIGPVAALRETSVLFVTLIGILILRERWSAGSVAGAVLIGLGIATLAWKAG